MVAVAHDDVADPHGDADTAGTLDLGAANLDGVAVADIFLDRRSEPGRGDVEIDRPCTKPPPQPTEANREDDGECCGRNREPLHPALTDHPAPQRADPVADAVDARARARQQFARTVACCLVVLVPRALVPTMLLTRMGMRMRLQRRPLTGLLARSGRRSGFGSSSLGCFSRSLGRRIPCHCLSVLALIAGWFAAKGAPVDPHRALLCRHRCQSPVFTMSRCRPQRVLQRADGWCFEILVTIL